MWPLLIAGAVGALAMGQRAPRTKCEKKTSLGAVTGTTYEVEEFKDAGFITVKAPDGSVGVFEYASLKTPGQKGFAWRHGRGQPPTLQGMYQDFVTRTASAPAPGPKKPPGAPSMPGP